MPDKFFGKLPVREISISDRDKFFRYGDVSFLNFTNIFSWRSVTNFRIGSIDGTDCIIGRYRNRSYTLLPPFYTDKISASELFIKVKELIGNERLRLCPLTPDMLDDVRENLPSANIESVRAMSDYIYNTSDLTELSGKKYHQKRNHLNGFILKYDHTYISVHPGDQNALALLREASERLYRPDGNPDLIEEYAVINELIDNFDALDLRAGIIIADSRPVAYSIGEKMSENTALIHIEKADRDYSGAFAAINNMFVKNEFSDTEFINREEDMGLEGLRKAKLSYRPVRLGDYYCATL